MNLSLIKLYELENKQCVKCIESFNKRVDVVNYVKVKAIKCEIKEMYEQVIERNNNRIKEIMKQVNSLDGIELDIIKLRYLEGLCWQDIADRLYISVSTAHRTHKKAIKALQEK